jgi:hypothetical protein
MATCTSNLVYDFNWIVQKAGPYTAQMTNVQISTSQGGDKQLPVPLPLPYLSYQRTNTIRCDTQPSCDFVNTFRDYWVQHVNFDAALCRSAWATFGGSRAPVFGRALFHEAYPMTHCNPCFTYCTYNTILWSCNGDLRMPRIYRNICLPTTIDTKVYSTNPDVKWYSNISRDTWQLFPLL